MRIAVLGTGGVGRTLADAFRGVGHDVALGSRAPGEGAVAHAEAVAGAELVVVALPGAAVLETLQPLDLDGRVVLDVSNPLRFTEAGPELFTTGESLAEQLQRQHAGARVVKALNTVNSDVMVDPHLVPGRHLLPVCGDDEDAKHLVVALLGDLGWGEDQLVDLGGLRQARATEGYLLLWVALMQRLGTARFNVEVRRGG